MVTHDNFKLKLKKHLERIITREDIKEAAKESMKRYKKTGELGW